MSDPAAPTSEPAGTASAPPTPSPSTGTLPGAETAAAETSETSAAPGTSPPAQGAPTAASGQRTATPPPTPTGPPLAERAARKAGQGIEQGARAAWRGLAERRGLRVALAGAVVLLVALRLGTDSALSVPLLIVGLVMVTVGAMGPRLRGRFSLEFGPDGTSIEVQTHIAAPGKTAAPVPALPVAPERPRIALVHPAPAAPVAAEPSPEQEPAPADAVVVEGHGETIEMDVEQLRALLAAERAG